MVLMQVCVRKLGTKTLEYRQWENVVVVQVCVRKLGTETLMNVELEYMLECKSV